MSERIQPHETMQRLFEDAEKRTAHAMDALVKRDSFGELLARHDRERSRVAAHRQ